MKHQLAYLFLFLLFESGGIVFGQTVFVWPGDVNDNGIVNHNDLLFLGIHHGRQGTGRDSVSIDWLVHEVPKWLPAVGGRIDPAHADCNGDSTVNNVDVTAITQNYGLDNGFITADSSSLSNQLNLSSLSFDLSSGPLLSGTTDTIPLNLGSATSPIDSLLGFAATITYDTSLVDTAFAWFGDSWLGTPGQDLVYLERHAPGNLALAATRTDRINAINGQGGIGGIVVVMDDNLKSEVALASLRLSFSQALCMTTGGDVIRVQAKTGSVLVQKPVDRLLAQVFPIPTNFELHIALHDSGVDPTQGRLVDAMGRIVHAFQFSGREFSLETSSFQNGIYFLDLDSGGAILRQKVILLHD